MREKVTREHVAKLAGVSPAVVTWVKNGSAHKHRISESTIEKVEALILELGYKPSIWGKLINTQRSGLIAFISFDITDPSANELIRQLGVVARERGYGLLLYDLAGMGMDVDALLKNLDNSLADAFILHLPEDNLLALCADDHFHQRPVCVVGRDLDRPDLCSIEVDNVLGARISMEHALSLNPARLGVISDQPKFEYTRQRAVGYAAALDAGPGLEVPRYTRRDDQDQFMAGQAAMESWLAAGRLPDVFIAMADVLAIGALSALSQRGMAAPKDIKAVGFDGTIFSRYACPPLTTVAQPYDVMARDAIDKCHRLLNRQDVGERKILRRPTLLIRDTTRTD